MVCGYFLIVGFYGLRPFLNDCVNKWIFKVPPTYKLPFEGKHFIDVTSSPGYETIYFIHLYMTYFMIFSAVSFYEKMIRDKFKSL